MHQLIYVSRATDVFFLKELEDLLAKARKNNERLGITGMLLYSVNMFFQLLEGDAQAVSDLYVHIAKDTRHTDVRIIANGTVEKPSFSDWKMGYANPDPRKIKSMPGFSNFFDKGFDVLAFAPEPDQAKQLLLSFR